MAGWKVDHTSQWFSQIETSIPRGFSSHVYIYIYNIYIYVYIYIHRYIHYIHWYLYTLDLLEIAGWCGVWPLFLTQRFDGFDGQRARETLELRRSPRRKLSWRWPWQPLNGDSHRRIYGNGRCSIGKPEENGGSMELYGVFMGFYGILSSANST